VVKWDSGAVQRLLVKSSGRLELPQQAIPRGPRGYEGSQGCQQCSTKGGPMRAITFLTEFLFFFKRSYVGLIPPVRKQTDAVCTLKTLYLLMAPQVSFTVSEKSSRRSCSVGHLGRKRGWAEAWREVWGLSQNRGLTGAVFLGVAKAFCNVCSTVCLSS
jgi:hypothetical protein